MESWIVISLKDTVYEYLLLTNKISMLHDNICHECPGQSLLLNSQLTLLSPESFMVSKKQVKSPSPNLSIQTLSEVPVQAPMRLTPQVNEQCSPSTQEMNNITPLA